MSRSDPQPLARILAAPWQQRRSTGGAWGAALVVALCLAAPVVLFTWSLFSVPGEQVSRLRESAVISLWIGVAALLVVGWAMFVGNVLQQNHPTLARLVPRHAEQLRLALVVGWVLACLAAVALPGFAFDAPLEWGCGTAVALVTLAAALRWPLLWLGGIAAPFVVNVLTRTLGAAQTLEAARQQWDDHRVLVACGVAVAGAAVLACTVRGGGRRHSEAYERRQRLREMLVRQEFGAGLGGSSNAFAWLCGLAVPGRPYAWWMARLVARPGAAVMPRLLVGLGPATHWTTRIVQALWFIVTAVVVCALMALFLDRAMFAYVLPWMAFSFLTGVCSPALMAVPQLQQTQREQALLALLPGVPRGARLNRWLAWQMSATYVVAALCGLALAWGLNVVADAIRPGVSVDATGGMTLGIAAVLLPQVAWQWRRWARLRGTGTSVSQVPTIAPIVLGIGVMVLHASTGVGYAAVGAVLAAVALAWCAWRWQRMGVEPTAFPVGRLS